ncbi:MAG: hypothetical protein ABIH66_02370 [bacterium]
MLKRHKKYVSALVAMLCAGLLLNVLAGKAIPLALGFPCACVLLAAIASFTQYAAGAGAMKAVLLILVAAWLGSPFYSPLLGKEEFQPPDSLVIRCESGRALHKIVLREEKHLDLARAARRGELKARLFVLPLPRDSIVRLTGNGAALPAPRAARPGMTDVPAEALEEKNGSITLYIEIENPERQFLYRPTPPSKNVSSFCINEGGAPTPVRDVRLLVELRFYDKMNRIRHILY